MGDREAEPQDDKAAMILYMAAIMQVDAGIEAAKAEADAIEEELLIVNNWMMTIDSLTERRVNSDRWSFSRRRWFLAGRGGLRRLCHLLGEKFFKRAFRVTPATFRYTMDAVRPLLERQNTNMREAIALGKTEDRSVTELFAVVRSTVNVTYRELFEAIWRPSGTKFPQLGVWPSTFASSRPDRSHFPVSPPKEGATDYRNYKGWMASPLERKKTVSIRDLRKAKCYKKLGKG
ncbi:hypothetical protein HPB49_019860 [Dermacentor silvarum]|uniref:Uncharacterized protein n=1 Tax=Dermacentor silvarum TaxID=543639 RepID=A0ACB8CH18_DERSI|nr:hypothetical protein HPB49_019860 [Dermacentor silvarum]